MRLDKWLFQVQFYQMAKIDNRDHRADVLIVGCGMVGGTLAIALSNVGLKIVIIDQLDPSVQESANFDGRASAIAATPQKMLKQLGIWKQLSRNFTTIEDIRVVDGRSSFYLHYNHKDVYCDALGFMVENRHFRQAYLSQIQNNKNITFIAPTKINQIIRNVGGVHALLNNGAQIKSDLVIGADGRHSKIREIAGIHCTKWTYSQTAIVLTVDHQIPHNNVAYEHFFPGGPFAILPQRGDREQKNRSSIVWTEKTDLTRKILSLPDYDFKNEFKKRFGEHLGDFRFVGPRWHYPLYLHFTETCVAERLVLVGDAAHGIHPIAGQGLNLGFRDVAALAEIVIDAKRLGIDIGEVGVLEKYQKWRRFDNSLMVAMTDGLNRLFSNDISPIKVFRDLGLGAVNKANPLKKLLMLHAMGSIGNLPRLLKGEEL